MRRVQMGQGAKSLIGRAQRTAARWAKLPDLLLTPVLGKREGVSVLEIAAPAGARITNPSVSVVRGELLVAVREVDYRVDWRGRYCPDGEFVAASATWLGSFDVREGSMGALRPLVVDGTPSGTALEDPRVIETGQDVHIVWAKIDREHPTHASEIVVGSLDDDRVSALSVLASPRGALVEKNWMPFDRDGELRFLYTPNEGIQLRFEGGDVTVCEAPGIRDPKLLGHSGSSQLIDWNGGWLGVTHSYTLLAVPGFKIARRIYRHAFVYYSRDFETSVLSEPFYFRRRGIEFCAGIALVGDDAYLSFGANDTSAHIAVVPVDLLRTMLEQGVGAVEWPCGQAGDGKHVG